MNFWIVEDYSGSPLKGAFTFPKANWRMSYHFHLFKIQPVLDSADVIED